ncbi:MAG: hypothetical protein WBE72_05770 [Terracidiphilus sp.]
MNRTIACLGLCACFLACGAGAQTPSSDPAGPVPPAIRAARKIFISNAGSDSGLFPEPFSGDPNRPYTEFYNTLKAAGQYQLMNDPAQADLVLELRLLAPNGPQIPNKMNGASDPLPMLRLVVYDRATHYVLWAITESVAEAILQKSHDHNLDEAIEATVADFQRVSGTAPAPAATP